MGCILQRDLVLIQPLNKSGFCRNINVKLDPPELAFADF